jgi:hypothetical protein
MDENAVAAPATVMSANALILLRRFKTLVVVFIWYLQSLRFVNFWLVRI